jgi:hypothetical protein
VVLGNGLDPGGLAQGYLASAQRVATCDVVILLSGLSAQSAPASMIALANVAASRLAQADSSDPFAGIPAPSTFLSNVTQWLDQLLTFLVESAGRLADLARYWIGRFADLISYWTARIIDLADNWFSRSVPLARSWLHQANVRVQAIQAVVGDPAPPDQVSTNPTSTYTAPADPVSTNATSANLTLTYSVSSTPTSADPAPSDPVSRTPTSADSISTDTGSADPVSNVTVSNITVSLPDRPG